MTRALMFCDKAASLHRLYEIVSQHPRVQGRKKASWQGKLRQQLQAHPKTFVRTSPGMWSFTSLYSDTDVEQFEQQRRSRWPKRVRNQDA